MVEVEVVEVKQVHRDDSEEELKKTNVLTDCNGETDTQHRITRISG